MPIEQLNREKVNFPSRSNKNSKLYREVYGKYEGVDNLPIEDNTDEIDMARLRELVYNNEGTVEHKNIRESLDVIDTKKRNFDKERMYDINKILEKAKYENNKLKEPISEVKSSKKILSTLQSDFLGSEDVADNGKSYNTYSDCDNMYMTREFKFKELNDKISELNASKECDMNKSDEELSLDLFEDLKPVGNTVITKPIVDSSNYKGDMHSSDTRDIDIIKPVASVKDESFFTGSYEFSKKDFDVKDSDDFFDEKKTGGNVLQIFLLLVAILVFSFVIVYFVFTYGIGV